MTRLLALLLATGAPDLEHAAEVERAARACDVEVLGREAMRLRDELGRRQWEPAAEYMVWWEWRRVSAEIKWCGARL